MELKTPRLLSEANFNRGIAKFGEQRMVGLVSVVGFYSMVGMTLNAFDVLVPSQARLLD
jgi:hypothetical protein